MKLDRSYQKEILTRLSEDYPNLNDENTDWFIKQIRTNGDGYACNVMYLIEHGLLSSGVKVARDASGGPGDDFSSNPHNYGQRH